MRSTRRNASRSLGVVLGAALLACAGIGGWSAPVLGQTGPVKDLPLGKQNLIKIGFDTFSDTEAINVIAKQMLERLGYTVEIQSLNVAVLYASVADGKLDEYSGGNLPNNHKDYWERFGDRIDAVGPFHKQLRIGMAAPAYVDVDSIAELKGREAEFGNRVLGNTPGSGNMRQTANAIKVYGLDMKLIESSEAAQSAAMNKAIKAKEPIAFAAWSPNWWWGKWKLKFLDDPKKAYAPTDGVYHLVRKGLDRDAPRAFGFYKNYTMSADQQGYVMLQVVDGRKAEDVARKFIDDNPDLVKKWLGE